MNDGRSQWVGIALRRGQALVIAAIVAQRRRQRVERGLMKRSRGLDLDPGRFVWEADDQVIGPVDDALARARGHRRQRARHDAHAIGRVAEDLQALDRRRLPRVV